ncbi:effector-associated constant component EACC1 [Amycolatopsis japonica]|uniref:effector-associated constant component EACC1 n=1 Tax=Amycolatopsis japonica TaxID=208439 RepID=UPI0033FD3A0E
MVNAVVTAEGSDTADQLRSLHEWLAGVQELRGAVGLRESPPPQGALGPVLDALAVALGPAGAVTAFATATIAWLRTRPGEVRVKVTQADGRSLELTAKNVANLDAEALRQQVEQVSAILDDGKNERLDDR